jgi:signal transduction histidine kinase
MAERTTLLRARRLSARRPLVFDTGLGLLIAALLIVAVLVDPGPEEHAHAPLWADLGSVVLAFVLIALRRRWPVSVFAVATVAALIAVNWTELTPSLLIAALMCAYTVAAETNRRTAWLAGGGAAVVFYAGAVLAGRGWTEPESLGMVAWTGMAVALGDALRTRRAYVAAIEDRALRAEQSRDEEARRQVVEERLRIARELHDVVAHHIAMINVQAGVAAHVLRQRPDQAEDALAHIRKAARTVLDETATLLDVLRRPEDPDESEPTRGLGRLAGLLDSLGGSGLRVEYRQEGDARDLPAAVDLAAYRIVQESLTNAHKHGSEGAARLLVAYTGSGLTVTVSNAAAGPGLEGNGHGLLGMRERVASVGGTLRTERKDGRFVVTAFLPAEEKGQA